MWGQAPYSPCLPPVANQGLRPQYPRWGSPQPPAASGHSVPRQKNISRRLTAAPCLQPPGYLLQLRINPVVVNGEPRVTRLNIEAIIFIQGENLPPDPLTQFFPENHMALSRICQHQDADAANTLKPAQRSLRVPYTSQTSGVRSEIFNTPRSYTSLIQEGLDAYRGAFNAIALAERAGSPAPAPEGPYALAAARHYRKCRAKAQGPLRVRSARRMGTVPAVGPLWDLLVANIDVDVIKACFVQNPDGTFCTRVVYQGQPRERVSLKAFIKDRPRPSYAADLGCAIMPDGLHISEMTIRDACGSEEFRTGKVPTRYFIPKADLIKPGFAQNLWKLLTSKHVPPRTLTLDLSCLQHLSSELKPVATRISKGFRRQSAVSAVVYRKVSTVGLERQQCRDNWAATGVLTPRMLAKIVSQVPLECPQCGAVVSLKADPKTGAPLRSQERCGNCCRSVDVGNLLADRARTRGVHGWQENISGPRVMATNLDLRRAAKHDTGAANAVANDRKVTQEASTRGDLSDVRLSKATGRAPHAHPSTRCHGVAPQPVTGHHRSSRPSQGQDKNTPTAHTTRGLVRKSPRQGRLVQQPAPTSPSPRLLLLQQRYEAEMLSGFHDIF